MANVEKSSSTNSAAKANPLMQVRLKQYATTKAPVNMEMLQESNNVIIKLVQNKHFKDEVQKIRQKEGYSMTLRPKREKWRILEA